MVLAVLRSIRRGHDERPFHPSRRMPGRTGKRHDTATSPSKVGWRRSVVIRTGVRERSLVITSPCSTGGRAIAQLALQRGATPIGAGGIRDE
jgi:hypothetical protein